MALVSLRAYARHRGVNLSAVQKAVKTERISLIDGKIDPQVADIQWAQNTRPDQQERGSLKDFEKTQADLLSQPKLGSINTANGQTNLSAEKSETESIRRQLMELQLAQKRGELVRADDIERALASKLKSANEALNGLADRLAPILAAETNVDVVDQLLRTEIRRAMALIAQQAPETTQ